MRVHTVLIIGVLLAGCASGQSSDQFRILREELSIVREKLDKSQKQLESNQKLVQKLEQQVRLLSGNIEKKPYCKLKMPGLKLGGTRAVSPRTGRGGADDLMSPFAGRRVAPAKVDFAKFITRVGVGRYRIKRAGLNKVLANTTLLARSARIVPSVRNGVPNGFKLYAIRPGSLYAFLGFRNGDTVNAINGQSITTPDKALEIFTKLRKANKLTIQFTRRGRPMVHRYVVVP